MIYARSITSPFGADVTNPTDTVIHLTKGFIYQLDLYFPSGSQGLLKVQIHDHQIQLYPFNVGEYFYGDDGVISFPESHLIDDPPFELIVRHYNEDEAYDHSFQIRIGIVAAEVFIARFLPSLAAEEMAKVIIRIKDDQESERIDLINQQTEQLSLLAGVTPDEN